MAKGRRMYLRGGLSSPLAAAKTNIKVSYKKNLQVLRVHRAIDAIPLFIGGTMPVRGGNPEKHLEPPLDKLRDIAGAMVNGCNDIVPLQGVGGHVAAIHYILPQIYVLISLNLSHRLGLKENLPPPPAYLHALGFRDQNPGTTPGGPLSFPDDPYEGIGHRCPCRTWL